MSRRERGTDPDATLPQAHRYHDDPTDDDDQFDADESNTFTIRPGDDEAGSDEEYLNGWKKSSISKSKGNGCGINGDSCRPFDNSTFTFRCPASCLKTFQMEPYAVGDQIVNYRPIVVGGPTNISDLQGSTQYRGDSFICGSAIHAGFVSNDAGGCAVLKLTGQKSKFPSTKSHGIESIGFDSYFPQSFSFVPGTASECRDLRWPLLAVSVVFSAILSIFTASPLVFFVSIFTALFFHVAL
ncbi:hypothetical protein LTS18_006569, partial [Coniosporium uncinatum]